MITSSSICKGKESNNCHFIEGGYDLYLLILVWLDLNLIYLNSDRSFCRPFCPSAVAVLVPNSLKEVRISIRIILVHFDFFALIGCINMKRSFTVVNLWVIGPRSGHPSWQYVYPCTLLRPSIHLVQLSGEDMSPSSSGLCIAAVVTFYFIHFTSYWK